ncbi:antitoxin Xre-like helix-turn-helix domain-containing protein [Chromobacterium subtsugae]|uniref:antitoxin Xre-like helix-turn-helix domain-containing protein n=1 Tax=Chromobacterium subtsugae TaxID=251747 RepID=UPI00069B80AA|nr:antitoxin Xre-like helix-turn-helix domain-containing protein [Chromobacterium subtsugae]
MESPSKGAATIKAWLDLPTNTQIEMIRQGLPATAIHAVSEEFDIPIEHLCLVLGLSPRLASHRISRQRLLDLPASEKLLRIMRIAHVAEVTLGSKKLAGTWLQQHNITLNASPLSLMDTELGGGLAQRVLASIEHGLPV